MSEDDDLLVHNCINEVLNGLARSHLVQSVLLQRAQLSDLLQRWVRNPTTELIRSNASLLRSTIACVMSELEDGEFETRVGVSKVAAEKFVSAL